MTETPRTLVEIRGSAKFGARLVAFIGQTDEGEIVSLVDSGKGPLRIVKKHGHQTMKDVVASLKSFVRLPSVTLPAI